MKFSIITPSLNQRRYLVETARSVLSQGGDVELEWIVVDGGSTDGTVDLLRSMNDARLRWSSTADGGQANAINRGLAEASGDIVAWLNSDDLYAPDALAAVRDAFYEHPDAQWLVGQCDIIDDAGRPIRSAVSRYKRRALSRYSYRKLLRENFVPQPACFWRRPFGQQVGRLDESLHWTMDYDLWLRMGRLTPPLIPNRLLARFRLHGDSKTGQVDRRQFDEQYAVARRYFNGDRWSQATHRLNVEKVVWAYRLMRLLKV